MEFKEINAKNMAEEIWPVLKDYTSGRTTDFSYGGVLMWVDYFRYKYHVEDGTVFIKGRVEDDREKKAFSLPIGKLSVKEGIDRLKSFCREKGWNLELSAVPEEAMEEVMQCGPVKVEELAHWGDYLYDANSLATLSGNKYSKKRNRFNKFDQENPDWHLELMTPGNCDDALKVMDKVEEEADHNEEANDERQLTRKMISLIKEGDKCLLGAILYTGDTPCAFTIGDIKGDTLFIHIEKGMRSVTGSFEAVNKLFVEAVLASFPGIEYVNREDDAGDMGLKIAKESYHPVKILKKYNVIF